MSVGFHHKFPCKGPAMKQTYECLLYSEIQAQLEKYDLKNRQTEHIVDR